MPTITFTSAWSATLVRAATATTPAVYSGSLTVTGTTDYAASGILLTNVIEVVTVTGPDLMDYTITINPSVSRSGAMVLPQSITGTVQEGTYSLEMVSTVSGGTLPGEYLSAVATFDYCISPVNPVLTPSVDCVCAQVSFTDQTNYTGVTIVSRTLTLTPPTYTGIWSPVTTSTLSSVSSAGLDLYKGTYTGQMSLVATKGGITYTYNIRQTVDVDCKSICEMFCALENLFNKAQENIANPAEKAKQLDAIALGSAYATMANQSQSCNSSALASLQTAFWNVISPWIKSTDCCDCCDGADIIQPRCGTGTGGSYTFFAEPSQYLIRTVVGTAITYLLTPAAVAILNAVRVYDITSSDGSVVVTPSGGATPGSTKTFDLSTPAVNQMSFFYTENFLAGTAAITNLTRLGSIWKTPSVNPTVSPATIAWLSVMEVSDLFNAPQAFKVDVRIVAQSAIKALSPQTGINSVIAVELADLPATGTASDFSLQFFDEAATHPVYRNQPIGYNNLGAYLEYMTLQITIYQ